MTSIYPFLIITKILWKRKLSYFFCLINEIYLKIYGGTVRSFPTSLLYLLYLHEQDKINKLYTFRLQELKKSYLWKWILEWHKLMVDIQTIQAKLDSQDGNSC